MCPLGDEVLGGVGGEGDDDAAVFAGLCGLDGRPAPLLPLAVGALVLPAVHLDRDVVAADDAEGLM